MKLNLSGFIPGMVSFMICTGYFIPLFSQNINSCQVGVSYEPRAEKVSLRPSKISQSTYSYLKKWSQKNEATIANDVKAGLILPAFAHSTHLVMSEFGASIPSGSTIQGIEVWIEGQSSKYTSLGEISVTLFADNSNVISQNKANTALAQKAWSQQPGGSDKKWCYGGKTDTWGLHWQSDWLNADNFQLELQLRNATSQQISVDVDDIEIIIHYTPLYAFCKDSCVVFYVDPGHQGKAYQWILPPNFMAKSRESENAINLMAGNGVDFGTYKICAEIYNGAGQVSDTCCRYFNYHDCAMSSIAGVAWKDLNNNKQRDVNEPTLPGVTVQLKNLAGNTIREVVTSTNGQYDMHNIPSGQYYLKTSGLNNALFVLKDLNVPQDKNSDITNQNGPGSTDVIILGNTMLTNIDLGFIDAGSIGNFVWHDLNGNGVQESSEPGLANIQIELQNANAQVVATAQSDQNGGYYFGLLTPGSYFVQVNIPAGYQSTCQVSGANVNNNGDEVGKSALILLSPGQQVDSIDFGLWLPGEISGTAFLDIKADGVFHTYDPGIEAINFVISGMTGCGLAYIDTASTNVNGEYTLLNVPPGNYEIKALFPDSYFPTKENAGPDGNIMKSDGSLGSYVIQSGQSIVDLWAGLYQWGSISGLVWQDDNVNSYRDSLESGLANQIITLSGLDAFGIPVTHQHITDVDGNYHFANLVPGTYDISLTLDSISGFSPKWIQSDTLRDHDSENGLIGMVQVCSGVQTLGKDFAVFMKSSLGDFVWEDVNGNGIQETGEPGLPGIEVLLEGSDFFNQPLQRTTLTNSDGLYSFDLLNPGEYRLSFTAPAGYRASKKDLGSDDTLDSDLNESFESEVIVINSGLTILNVDAGLYLGGNILGSVWEDMACDGLLNIQDVRLEGVRLFLEGQTTTGEAVSEEVLTEASGQYVFTGLAPGIYSVSVETTGDYLATQLVIFPLNIQSGTSLLQVDFPLFRTAGLGDFIWFDENENGIQDATESGLDSIQVRLSGFAGGNQVQRSTLSENGYYYFQDLKPGTYELEFLYPVDFVSTIQQVGSDPTLDSDINGSGKILNIILNSGQQNVDADAGFIEAAKGEIGDFVWHDVNGDGIQGDTEPGLPGVLVLLDGTETNGTLVQQQATTDASGYYSFINIRNGNYTVTFTAPQGYFVSPQNQGNGSNDSRPNPSTGIISSIVINGGNILLEMDAGFYQDVTMGDFVWFDQNENGLQDIGESGVEGVLISIYEAIGNGLMGSMYSDASGQYSISGLRPGLYYATADIPEDKKLTGYQTGSNDLDSDFIIQNNTITTEDIFLFSGQNDLNVDLGLVNKKTSLSGIVWLDQNANGILEDPELKLDSLTVYLLNESGDTLAAVLTDSSGYYFFGGLSTGLFKIKFPVFDSLTYTRYQAGTDPSIDNDVLDFNSGTISVNLTLGDEMSGLNAGYIKKSSLGDFVWLDINEDGLQGLTEPGLNGIKVELYNFSNELLKTTTTTLHPVTGNSGYYHFDNLFPGDYFLRFELPNNLLFTLHDTNQLLLNSDVTGLFGTGTTDTIVLGYQVFEDFWDCGLIIDENAQGELNGVVWQDENANGTRESSDLLLEGVEVKLLDLSGMELAITFTDNLGRYSFENLFFGSYYLSIPDVINRVFVLYTGMNPLVDSEITNEFGPGTSRIISLFPGDSLDHLDLGYAPKISIGDFVWEDINDNGRQDIGEPGVPGILIQLINQSGIVIDSRTTDVNGKFIFEALAAGNYGLRAVVNGGYLLAQPNKGPADLDSKADLSGFVPNRDFINAGDYDNLDIGLIRAATIGSRLWLDLNGNGIFTSNEPGLQDIMVELYNESGVLVKTTKTNALAGQDFVGSYMFKGVRPGNYYVRFIIPDNYQISPANIGAPENDSDITNSMGRGTTDIFAVSVGEIKSSIDGAAFLPACIGDRVWNDLNHDGIQDTGESGIAGVLVSLFTSSGQLVDTTRTNAEGEYKFFQLRSRLYYLRFSLPEGFEFTLPFQGSSAALDSDVDETGTTPLISLAHGSVFLDVDAGMSRTQNRIIFGTVWDDINKDGLKDGFEIILPEVDVNLTDAAGNILAHTKTNHAGLYAHALQLPGKYYIQVIEKENYRITRRAIHNVVVCNDINANGMSDAITFAGSPEIQHKNGGMYFQPSTKLSGHIWLDNDDDFVWNNQTDSLVQDVVVLLFSQQNVFVKSTKTNDNGFFELNDIDPGYYYVKIPVLEQKEFILHNESQDSYITNERGEGTSSLIMLNVQNPGENFNLGYKKLPGIIENPEEAESFIIVYPNPTIFNIHVELDTYVDEVPYRIINTSGKMIQKGTLLQRLNEINLTDVPLGVYILELQTKDGMVRKKFFRAENY